MPPNYFNLLNPKRIIHPFHKSLWLILERIIRLWFLFVVYPMVFSMWSVRYPLNLTRFSLIPEKTAYLWDRYAIHASPCILQKLYNGKQLEPGYIFNGIKLSKYEGFNDYLAYKVANEAFAEGKNSSPKTLTTFCSSTGELELVENTRKIPSFEAISDVDDVMFTGVEADSDDEQIIRATKFKGQGTSQKVNKIKEVNLKGQPQTKKTKKIVVNLPNTYTKQQQIRVVLKKHKLKKKGISFQDLKVQQAEYRPSFIQSTTDPSYIEHVKEEIKKIFHSAPKYDDGSLAPIILRLSWHCCATFDSNSKTGGSNGSTMRYVPEITDEGNTGLDIARAALEPVKQKFPLITYSDLWTLAGVLALESMCDPVKVAQLNINWMPGRTDCIDNSKVPPNGRLPFAYKDANHVRSTFHRMGFDVPQTVALCGAHCIGRCHKRFSGWEGKWTHNPVLFTNEFFRALINEEWISGIVPETGRQQYYNSDKLLMMLNTDIELTMDSELRFWVEKYANDEKLFFQMFSIAFSKLLELGIERDPITLEIIHSS